MHHRQERTSAHHSTHAFATKALLVRNRSAIAEIVPALKAAGIRYRTIEFEHLGERQVVQDLYALIPALLHLGDRIARLSIPARRGSSCLSTAFSKSPAIRFGSNL